MADSDLGVITIPLTILTQITWYYRKRKEENDSQQPRQSSWKSGDALWDGDDSQVIALRTPITLTRVEHS